MQVSKKASQDWSLCVLHIYLSHISFLDLDILHSRFLSIIRYTISKICRFPNFLVIKELMRQLAMFFILGIMIYGKFQLDRGLYYRISIISLSPDYPGLSSSKSEQTKTKLFEGIWLVYVRSTLLNYHLAKILSIIIKQTLLKKIQHLYSNHNRVVYFLLVLLVIT